MNKRGFSLIELVIASGIAITVMMAFMNLIQNQLRETKRLEHKLALLDVRSQLQRTLADAEKCLFNLNPSGTFLVNTTGIPLASSGTPPLENNLITLTTIYDGTAVTARKIIETNELIEGIPGVTTAQIAVRRWIKNADDDFTADLVVHVNSPFGPVPPITIMGLSVLTDTATPPAAERVVACNSEKGFSCRTVTNSTGWGSGMISVECNPDEIMTGGTCYGGDTCSGRDWSGYGGVFTANGIQCQRWHCNNPTHAQARCCK